MQSWGTLSRFTYRDTATEPTKSGVVGLLGAALGVARNDNEGIAKLAALRLGVRVDRPGTLEQDYHTVQNVPTTTGRGHRGQVTERFYLADATFLVVLEGDPELLANLAVAVHRPRWPLHFGRKAFVPARPLLPPPTAEHSALPQTGTGLQQKSLADVLTTHPWLEASPQHRQRVGAELASGRDRTLRTVVDAEPRHPRAELRHDHPVSFTRDDRRHTARDRLDRPCPRVGRVARRLLPRRIVHVVGDAAYVGERLRSRISQISRISRISRLKTTSTTAYPHGARSPWCRPSYHTIASIAAALAPARAAAPNRSSREGQL